MDIEIPAQPVRPFSVESRSSTPMKLRRTLLFLHRWVGVGSGLVILVVSVSGGILVFKETQDRLLNPRLFPKTVVAVEDRVPVSEVIEGLHLQHPEMRIAGIRLPRGEKDSLVLFSGNNAVYCDPGSGDILGIRPRINQWSQTFVKLHVNLLLGTTGGLVVEIATWITACLAITGLWLWGPLRILWFRRRPGFRRFHLDLHSVAGLYSSLFLLLICGTGITMRHFHPEHPRPPISTAANPDGHRVSVDTVIHSAEQSLPGAIAAAVEMPLPNPHAVFRIQLAFPEDGSPAGRSVVFIDQFSGDTLAVESSREGRIAERYGDLQLSLHTGAVGGTTTRWIALLTCIALVMQIWSGYVLWWKRKG